MAARLNHRHLAGPLDAIFHADAAIEADEIRAAAKEHVLAVVDDFIHARVQVGTGASAKIAAAFNELYAQPCLGQRTLPSSAILPSCRQPCPGHAGEAQRQNRELLPERHRSAMGEYIEIGALDALEQRMVNGHQNLQRRTALGIDVGE